MLRDIVMDDAHTSPPSGALFAVNMLVRTEAGGTFSFAELREDLAHAGFGEPTPHPRRPRHGLGSPRAEVVGRSLRRQPDELCGRCHGYGLAAELHWLTIKPLTSMPRRTPILAFLLAPVALVLLMLLWRHALVPLYRTVWYSDTVLQWRLDSRQPATRIAAAKDVGSSGTEDTTLLGELVAHLETDASMEVRKAAATTLGLLGWNRPLPADAIQALSVAVLTEQDGDLLSAAVGAVGRSAPNNRYPDPVVERIAGILSEEDLTPLHPAAATALGQVGAAQPLPDRVFEAMNAVFTGPDRPNEREYLVSAFTEIAKGQQLPVTTLELLADAFEHEPHPRIRRALIYALAHAAAEYPPAITLITEAAGDPDPGVVSAAENGLRIYEHDRDFADKDPLSLAVDTSQPPKVRRDALRIIRGSSIDPADFEQISALAQDPHPEIAIAALEMFHYLARSPDDDFDQRVLIPQLTRAMSDPDPLIREAAYGALSTISMHRPAYLRAGDFPAQFEAGANDPAPRVRVLALLAMQRDANDTAQRDALLERGLTDPDPYVRRMAVSWLGSPRIKTSRRQELIAQALNDSDPQVRSHRRGIAARLGITQTGLAGGALAALASGRARPSRHEDPGLCDRCNPNPDLWDLSALLHRAPVDPFAAETLARRSRGPGRGRLGSGQLRHVHAVLHGRSRR